MAYIHLKKYLQIKTNLSSQTSWFEKSIKKQKTAYYQDCFNSLLSSFFMNIE